MAGCRLTVPRQALLAALPALIEGGGERIAWGIAGTVCRAHADEFVLPRLSTGLKVEVSWHELSHRQVPFLFRLGETWQDPAVWVTWLKSQGIDIDQYRVGLVAFTPEGQATGWVRHGRDNRWEPIAEFNWPGVGMGLARFGVTTSPPAEAEEVDDRYSRLAGALTHQGLERLRSMSFAVVGVSRLGSPIAHTLARWGAGQIMLIDPDVVEPHNADSGEFHPRLDEGRKKVEVVAKAIRLLLPPGAGAEAYGQPLDASLAFSACRTADCIITCVDDDGARLVAAVLASSHQRVHLDIGTQVMRNTDGRIVAGADIRLLLPGNEPRCLNCFGGFAQTDALRRVAGLDDSPPPRWNESRVGSLRTLNQIAAHTGLRLIERLVNGEVGNSTWLRYEETPLPNLREIVPRKPWICPLCSTCHGIGDAIYDERELRIRRIARSIVRNLPTTGLALQATNQETAAGKHS